MKKRFKLGILGCDEVAINILRGVILSDFLPEKRVLAGDIVTDKFDEIMDLGVFATTDIKTIAENCEFLLFSGSKATFEQIVKKLNGCKHEKLISVIPNLKKNTIKSKIGISGINVARCVMNLPCAIGSGMLGVDMYDYNKNTEDTEFISKVFDCLGTVLSVDESKLDAVAGMNNPAYSLVFIDSLIDAGVKQGLTKDEAKIIAVQTLLGTAEMVQRDEQSVAELLMKVCKGGAAIESVKVLEDNAFGGIIDKAVTACANRSKELSEK